MCLGFLKGLAHSREEVAIKAINKARLLERSERVKNLLLEIRVHWSLAECSSAVKLLEIYENEQSVFLI